jgi:hypothetical protein
VIVKRRQSNSTHRRRFDNGSVPAYRPDEEMHDFGTEGLAKLFAASPEVGLD